MGGDLLIRVVHDFLALPAAILVPFLERSAEHSPQLKALLAEFAKDGNPLAVPEDSSAAAGRARRCQTAALGTEGSGVQDPPQRRRRQ